MQNNITNPADGQHVVIQKGQRVTGPLSQAEAQAEAQRRNKISEATGNKIPESQQAQVKVNLMG